MDLYRTLRKVRPISSLLSYSRFHIGISVTRSDQLNGCERRASPRNYVESAIQNNDRIECRVAIQIIDLHQVQKIIVRK